MCPKTQLTILPLPSGSPSPPSIPPAPRAALAEHTEPSRIHAALTSSFQAGLQLPGAPRTPRRCFLLFSPRCPPCPHPLCPLPCPHHRQTPDMMQKRKIRRHRHLFCMRALTRVLWHPKTVPAVRSSAEQGSGNPAGQRGQELSSRAGSTGRGRRNTRECGEEQKNYLRRGKRRARLAGGVTAWPQPGVCSRGGSVD